MKSISTKSSGRRLTALAVAVAVTVGLSVTPSTSPTFAAEVPPTPVGLGTAESFAVLAGTTVTNTDTPTVISGDLGLSPGPGTAVTGFPPGTVNNGTIHAADAVAAGAQLDLRIAFDDAAGRLPVESGIIDLTDRTLKSGVYSGGALELTGTVTLEGNASSVFIFQSAKNLITGPGSEVVLRGDINPCNVFWQVGRSATIGSGSQFVGTVLALTSITAESSATVEGRLLARNGAVTLDDNVITAPTDCASDTTDDDDTAEDDDSPVAPPAVPVPRRADYPG